MTSTSGSRVACVIPAKNEEERIAATVKAAAGLPQVATVIVIDDGSTDATAQHATAAGAIVVSHDRNRGKAAAIESGVNALGVLEQRDREPEAGVILLLDADLADSAAAAGPLIDPVIAGEAALTIGVLPEQTTVEGEPAGGHGVVVTTARKGIAELCGFRARAPLSGQRCLTRRAFELASPLAAGFGIEVGMTIDVVRAGLTVQEIDVDLYHRATGNDLAGQLHRARQLRDVTRALTSRGLIKSATGELRANPTVSGFLQRLRPR
ncbi:glycosyltransferase [Microlunatus elymi]|uniref:Glucosyl-3-phosphoglycerate synthase n=1 Tax=Microlunatus elymi TaxID=2596828 RepID=A0A516PUS3_9ACTN|nr:glycosyltransferase [Microlunatus elymi]QDP94945.1 glycosyltransferase [Microlunatus elymi]